MEPVLTLSPSPTFPRTSPIGNLDTTPKLPKRERLASFSRLIASESFAEFIPANKSPRDLPRRKFKKRDWSFAAPTIQISPSSPCKQETQQSKPLNNAAKGFGYFDSYQLPFSPSLLNRKSPKYLSPNYKQPTPTKSPLYRSDQRSLFLGRGSFGNVSLCIYKGSKFALKVTRIGPKSVVGEKNLLGFRHPHLVSILHISEVLDQVFICMEFAGHCNLQQVLDTKSELDFPRRLSFCLQTLSGLRHCHQHRIVHADVKPANVIVSPHGICKLGDFGHSLVHSEDLDNDAVQEDVVGTVAYAAPEVLRGARPAPAADVYSYGILLWQVETRELPFAGEHPHVIIYKVAHYGARPKFSSSSDRFTDTYIEVAKLCWHSDPNKRLTASQTHDMLTEITRK